PPGGPHTEDVVKEETAEAAVEREGQYGSPFARTRQKYFVPGTRPALWKEVVAASEATTRVGRFAVSSSTSYRNAPAAALHASVTEEGETPEAFGVGEESAGAPAGVHAPTLRTRLL